MIPELTKIQPHDVEAELAVLSALFLDADAIEYAATKVSPRYFFKKQHQEIYRAIIQLYSDGIDVDALTVTNYLKNKQKLADVGGAAYIADVVNAAPSSANIKSHIKILQDKLASRLAISEASHLVENLYDGADDVSLAIKQANENLESISKTAGKGVSKGQPEEVLKYYDELRITSDSEVPEITPIVKIDEAVICTPENITTISGESKSSKSALANVILAGSIYQDDERAESFKYLTIKKNVDKKAVLHFDTEQSRTIHKARHCGIIRRAGIEGDVPYYFSYNIRKLNIDDYQEVTTEICEAASKTCDGIFLIVVDGIADYIKSVNDEEMSNDIVHYFEQLAVEYSCPIITIIHLNPNSESKQRGHLGSQLQRKSESVLVVKKDKTTGSSWVEPQFLRNAGNENVPEIQFRYDESKKYHVYDGIHIGEKTSQMSKLQNYAEQMFTLSNRVSRKAAVSHVMEMAQCAPRTASGKLREMERAGLIEKEDPSKKEIFYIRCDVPNF